MSSSIFRRFSSSARLGDLLVQAGILTPSQLQEAMRDSRSKKLQIGQVLVMSGYMTARDLQIVLEAQSMLRDRTIDLNLAIQCIKVARKLGGNFSDVLEDYDASAAQRARTGKLGELLFEAGLVGEEDLSEAMERSVNTNMPLGRMLVLNRVLQHEVLQKALEIQVRLRDEVITREEAISALRQAAGLEGEAASPQPVQQEEKKKPVVRLGELLVMAGILNETDVMDALEWGLANQQPIGNVLVNHEMISQELLDAALFFQSAVREDKIDAMKACELLSDVFSTGVSPEEALAEAAPAKRKGEPDKPPISYQHLLTHSRVVTDEQIEAAFDINRHSAALIGKVLVLGGLMDVPTLQATLRCFQMVAKGWLSPDDAIASLDYCLHQNPDQPMAFEQALRDLKWTPETGLQMRGEKGTASSTKVDALVQPAAKAAPAAKEGSKERAEPTKKVGKEAEPVKAGALENNLEEMESSTAETNGEEQTANKKDAELIATKKEAEPVVMRQEGGSAATTTLAKTDEKTDGEQNVSDSEPSLSQALKTLYDDKTEDAAETTAPDTTAGDAAADDNSAGGLKKLLKGLIASPSADAKPADAAPEETKEEQAPPVAQQVPVDEQETTTEPIEEAKPAPKKKTPTKTGLAAALAGPLAAALGEKPAEGTVTQEGDGGKPKVKGGLAAALSGSLQKALEAAEASVEEPAIEKKVEEPAAEKVEEEPAVEKVEEEPAAEKVEEEPAAEKVEEEPAAEKVEEEPAAEKVEEEKTVEVPSSAPEAENESTDESEVSAEHKLESKSEEESKEPDAPAEIADEEPDATTEMLSASETGADVPEEQLEDVAKLSAEQLLVEIMKTAQNPELKPSAKRAGRFSETILPEDARARQLAKLVGTEASQNLADKLTFDNKGNEETPEAVDTAFGRLAETYFEQGNYKEAQVIYERMLVHRLNDLGPENPALVEDYNNLAMTLCVQGRFDKAEPFMKRAVHLYESLEKQDPVEFADYLHSLGTIAYKLEKHKEAEEIMLRVVTIRRESLPEDHEDIGRALADYAKVLKKLGKDDVAELIYKKAREILKRN